MGVRGANPHVLLRHTGLAGDTFLDALREIVRKAKHVEHDNRRAIALSPHDQHPCGSGLADAGDNSFLPGGLMETGEFHAQWRRDIGHTFASFEHSADDEAIWRTEQQE